MPDGTWVQRVSQVRHGAVRRTLYLSVFLLMLAVSPATAGLVGPGETLTLDGDLGEDETVTSSESVASTGRLRILGPQVGFDPGILSINRSFFTPNTRAVLTNNGDVEVGVEGGIRLFEKGEFINNSTVEIRANFSSRGFVSSFDEGSFTNNSSGIVRNQGEFSFEDGSSLSNSGTFDNDQFARIFFGFINTSVENSFENSGTFNNFGTLKNGGIGINNGLRTSVDNSGHLNNQGEFDARVSKFVNSGTLNTGNGGTLLTGRRRAIPGDPVDFLVGVLDNTGTITVGTSSVFDFSGSVLTNEEFGVLNNKSGGTLEVLGSVNIITGAFDGKIKNAGTVNNESGAVLNVEGGSFENDNPNPPGGNATPAAVNSAGTLNIIESSDGEGGTFTNAEGALVANTGQLNITGASELNSAGRIHNKGSGSINISDGGTLNNNQGDDIIHVDNSLGTSITVANELRNDSLGSINIGDNGTLNNKTTLENRGSVSVNAGGTFNNDSTGVIENVFSSSLIVNDGGTLNNEGALNVQLQSTLFNAFGGSLNNKSDATITNQTRQFSQMPAPLPTTEHF